MIADIVFGFLIGAVVGMILTAALITSDTEAYWTNRMIEEGNAVWTVDPKTGDKWFKTFPRKEVKP